MKELKKYLTVGDILNHEKLFSAYPWIKNIKVEIKGEVIGDNATADYYPNINLISFYKPLKHTKIINNVLQFELNKKGFTSLLHEIQHAIQTHEEFAKGGYGQKDYHKLYGEVEARNTQMRLKMTAKERKATSPSQTQDVKNSDVIVIFNGDKMANAPMPVNANNNSKIGNWYSVNQYTEDYTNDAEALYDPTHDRVYLFVSNLTKDTLPIVLTHETIHRAENIDPKLKAAIDRFEGDLQRRFNLNAKGIGTKEELNAYKRVITAKTPLEDQQAEYRAYLGEQFAKNPDSFTGKLKKIFQELIAAIRVALVRHGLDFGMVSKLTSADLWAVSRYGQTVPAESKAKTVNYRDRIEAMQKENFGKTEQAILKSAQSNGYEGKNVGESRNG